MFAVIKTGGKQYKVKEGQILKIEKIAGKVGDTVEFDQVLLTADEKGENIKIGRPYLTGTKVSAEILEQEREKKIKIIKLSQKSATAENVVIGKITRK